MISQTVNDNEREVKCGNPADKTRPSNKTIPPSRKKPQNATKVKRLQSSCYGTIDNIFKRQYFLY